MKYLNIEENTTRSFYIDSIFKRFYCVFTQNDEYNSRRRDKYMDPPYRVLVDRMKNGVVVWVCYSLLKE